MDLESNPYSPPMAPIGRSDLSGAYEIAGKGRRFLTYLIDLFLYFVCMFVVGIIIALTMGQDGPERLGFMLNVISFSVMIGYYVLFEGAFGRTPGKLICGTKVIDQNGGSPSIGQVLGRTACRFIPFEPFSFLGERGWHDSISKTLVVMAR